MDPLFSVTIVHQVTTLGVSGRIAGDDAVICKIDIGKNPVTGAVSDVHADHPAVRAVVNLLRRYLNGERVDFSRVSVETGVHSGFRKAVEDAVRRIPYGKTCSYSEVAAMAGRPGAVRAAASALRRNPVPVIIPCHRVIRKDGTAGGYCGALHGPQTELKKRLLRMEKPLSFAELVL